MSEMKVPKRNKESAGRILTVLLFMGIFTATFTVGSETEIPKEEQEILADNIEANLKEAKSSGDSSFIFLNNVLIGLMMVIPFGIGIIVGLGSAFVTGLTVGGFNIDVPAYLLLYTTPFGFMELVAYSISMSSSLFLTVGILKFRKNHDRNYFKKELKIFGIMVGISVALIFFGGIIENQMLGIGV